MRFRCRERALQFDVDVIARTLVEIAGMAQEARRGALRGSEELPRVERPRRGRRGSWGRAPHRSLDEFAKKGR